MFWQPGAFAIPAALADSTVRAATAFAAGSASAGIVAPAAAALAKGVLKTMILIKWQVGAAVTGACLLGAGAVVSVAAAVHAHHAPPAAGANDPAKSDTRSAVAKHAAALHDMLLQAHKKFDKNVGAAAPPAAAMPDDQDKNKSDADARKIKGNWKLVSIAVDGTNQAEVPSHRVTFEDENFQLRIDGEERAKGTYKLDSIAKPKTLDLAFAEGLHAGETMLGIFAWDGDRLKLCVSTPKGDRPKDFNAPVGAGHRTMVFEKE